MSWFRLVIAEILGALVFAAGVLCFRLVVFAFIILSAMGVISNINCFYPAHATIQPYLLHGFHVMLADLLIALTVYAGYHLNKSLDKINQIDLSISF